jgi:hypothetical protein
LIVTGTDVAFWLQDWPKYAPTHVTETTKVYVPALKSGVMLGVVPAAAPFIVQE